MAEPTDEHSRDDDEPGPRETELLWRYLDRITAGEPLDPEEILRDHPDVGPELLAQLEAFQKLGGDSAPDEPLGSLGDYILRREIGRGGMGVVYDAWQSSMNRRVALKVLPIGVAADRRAFTRFLREAQAAGQLSHPNVAAVHALGIDETTPYYAMEYIEGETLAQLRARIEHLSPDGETPFGPPGAQDYFVRIARAFAGVADGLQHAHEKGITHRDIKPSNLILDPDGRLRILDFGLAHLEGEASLTLSGDLIGTPLYMSPEQVHGERTAVDQRTDLYSLGATLYELLTFRPPFTGKDHSDTLSQIVEREPIEPRKLAPRVPVALQNVVLKCLRKTPEQRYGTAEALAQDLRRFVRGDPVEARPEAWLDRAARRWRRQRWRLVTATFILVSLAVSGVLLREYLAVEREREVREYAETMERAALVLQRGNLLANEHAGNLDLLDPRVTSVIKYVMPEVYERFELSPPDSVVAELESAIAGVPERPEAYYYLAKARVLLGHGTGVAAELLDAALRRDPSFVPAEFFRAAIVERGTCGTEGTLAASTAQETPARDPRDWRGVWLEAHRALRRYDWIEAVAAFDRLESLPTGEQSIYLGAEAESRLGSAKARLGAGQLGEAIEELSVAVRDWPDAVQPALLLARAHLLDDEPARAERQFERILERFSPDGDGAALVGAILVSAGEFARAEDWASRIQDPVLRAYVRGEVLLCMGRSTEASSCGERAVQLAPQQPRAHLLLGAARLRASGDNVTDARAAYQRSINLDAEFVPGHHGLGLVCVAQKEWGEAETWFRKAIAIDPGFVQSHFELGKALMLAGRTVEAKTVLEAALEIYPVDAHFHTALGYVLMMLGLHDEAVRRHRFALRLEPQFSSALVHLAISQVRRGRASEGIATFTKSIRANPVLLSNYRDLGELFLAGVPADAVARIPSLITAIEEQLPELQEHSELAALTTLALANLRLGTPEGLDRALERSEEAVELSNGRNADALLVRAKVLSVRGAEDLARQSLEDACELVLQRLGSAVKADGQSGPPSAAPSIFHLPELWLARLLVEFGEPTRAEELLRETIEKTSEPPRQAWDLWLHVSFSKLEKPPVALLDHLPASSPDAPAGSYRDDVGALLTSLAKREVVRFAEDLPDESDRRAGRPGRIASFRHVLPRIAYRIPLPRASYRVVVRLRLPGDRVAGGDDAVEVEGEPLPLVPLADVPGFEGVVTTRVDDALLDIDVGDDAASAPVVVALEIARLD